MQRIVNPGRWAVVAAGALLSLATIACGSNRTDPAPESSAEDRRQIRELYAGFSDAIEARDYQAACARLTPALRRELAGSSVSCREGLSGSLKGTRLLPEYRPRITSLQVAGGSATAMVRYGPDPQPERFVFTKRDGAWKIGSARR
jgi:hypothetical protein